MRIALRSSLRASRLAILSLTLLAGLLGASRATAQTGPPNTPPGVDHYLVYPVLNHPAIPIPVQLSDQFTRNAVHQVFTMDYFMTPVDKNGEGIIDPMTHYTWWKISTYPFQATALIQNQFSATQQFNIGQPEYLLNPALKNSTAGGPIPVKNHFKVYDAFGPPPARVVTLVDQFFGYSAYVDTAKFLALPCDKLLLATGQFYPTIDPVGHLAIYKINLQTILPPPPPPVVQDEFGTWQLELGPPVFLCVPSYKTGVTGIKAKTWGEIRQLYQ